MSFFTLIELMVVISIIAILAALLLPSLSMAREAGRAGVCLANLKQLGIGVISYADDYNGWLTPPRFNVAYSATVTDTLGRAVCETDNDSNWAYFMAANSRNRHFTSVSRLKYINTDLGSAGNAMTCPGDTQKRAGYQDSDLANGRDYLSYGINEGVTGTKRKKRSWSAWCRLTDFGRQPVKKRASASVIFADRDSTIYIGYSASVLPSIPGTDLISYGGLSGSPGMLGARHRRRVNSVFVDGHAAAVATPVFNDVTGGTAALYWLSPFHADGEDIY